MPTVTNHRALAQVFDFGPWRSTLSWDEYTGSLLKIIISVQFYINFVIV